MDRLDSWIVYPTNLSIQQNHIPDSNLPWPPWPSALPRGWRKALAIHPGRCCKSHWNLDTSKDPSGPRDQRNTEVSKKGMFQKPNHPAIGVPPWPIWLWRPPVALNGSCLHQQTLASPRWPGLDRKAIVQRIQPSTLSFDNTRLS